jgi:hypothetical protein
LPPPPSNAEPLGELREYPLNQVNPHGGLAALLILRFRVFMLRQFDSVLGCFLGLSAMIQAAGGDFEQVDSDAARDVRPSAGQADG